MNEPKSKPESDRSTVNAHLFSELMRWTPDSIYFKDITGNFIAVSRGLTDYWGFTSPVQVVGKSDFDIFPEYEAIRKREDEEELIRSGNPIIAKEEHEVYKDGDSRWVSTTKVPLRDAEGDTIGTFGISRDITDRKKAEAALRKSEKMLRRNLNIMEQELRNAAVVQRTLIPQEPPVHHEIETAFCYMPMAAVSGDYFNFYRTPNGDLAVFIGDLTGHGVSAALFMALVRFLTDELAEMYSEQPVQFLQQLNLKLMNYMCGTFLTGIFGVFQHNIDGTLTFRFAGSAHPAPLFYDSEKQEYRTLEYNANGALGILDDFECEEHSVSVKKGDRIFLFTDGISEPLDLKGNQLTIENLKSHFERSNGHTLSETLDEIINEIVTFRNSSQASDDLILAGFERKDP